MCRPTKTIKIDPVTKAETITTSSSFFASENTRDYYDFEGKRSDNHAKVSQAKIDFIRENAIKREGSYTTATERLQSNIIDSLLVGQIQTAPPPSGVLAPKTMADIFDRNLTSWAGIFIQGWQLYKGNSDRNSDSSMTISSSGSGSVFVGSNGNSLQDYTLSANGDAGYISGINFNNGLTYSPVSTTNETRGDTSYGLQLF